MNYQCPLNVLSFDILLAHIKKNCKSSLSASSSTEVHLLLNELHFSTKLSHIIAFGLNRNRFGCCLGPTVVLIPKYAFPHIPETLFILFLTSS